MEQLYHRRRRRKCLLPGTQNPLFLPESAMNFVSCAHVRTGMMKQKKRVDMVMVNSVHSSLRKNRSIYTFTQGFPPGKASDSAQQRQGQSRGETLEYHKWCGTGICEYGCKKNHHFKWTSNTQNKCINPWVLIFGLDHIPCAAGRAKCFTSQRPLTPPQILQCQRKVRFFLLKPDPWAQWYQ